MLRAAFIAALTAALVAAADPEVREDPPVARAPSSGRVRGVLKPASRVEKLSAVCRATGETYRPTEFDRETGSFVFTGLPGDAAYDVRILTRDDRRIEGVDLSWHEARMLRLAELRRKQLGLPAERGAGRDFTRDDADELLQYVRDLRDFANVRRALYLRGDGLRATMLVEVMRTTPFHAQRGDEIIWRTELWYFRYRYGGWERVPNVERVLERERISVRQWREITLLYDPALTAYVNEDGHADRLKYRIPGKADPRRGRIAGTKPEQDTRPIIFGLKEPESQPAQ